MTNSVDDKSFLTDTIENQPLLDENPPSIIERQPSVNESQSSINEKRISTSVEDSIMTSDKTEPSLSVSINSGLNDLSLDQKDGDLFPMIDEDQLDIL